MTLEQISDLEELRAAVAGCQACGLRAGCRGVVFGEGAPGAKLAFIGEGPGADEDRLLRPLSCCSGLRRSRP